MTRDIMDFDVVIVGAGPAGLSAAIRLAQLAKAAQTHLEICIIDKAESVGAHSLSGAAFQPTALDELIPDWQEREAPIHTPIKEDHFLLLTESKRLRLPTPPQMRNQGNYIISLGLLCQWLAKEAENLGVNIFPGFAATELLFEDHAVKGVITGDKGVDHQGQPKSNYQPGIELHAKQVIFAEGCRGSLTQQAMQYYRLCDGKDPQTYGLGLKELWEISPEVHRPGTVMHSVGWPLDRSTYGGSFVYHWGKNLLSIGFVIGLDYANPYLNPYEEFQRFKHHPHIAPLLKHGTRVAYGARTLIEGGLQSLPQLSFPGGLLVGDAAGFLNVPKIKGIHTAMKSAMVAAESVFPLLSQHNGPIECTSYLNNLQKTWLWEELYRARNIRPAMRRGLWLGLLYAAIDTYLFKGHTPWTLHHHLSDRESLRKANTFSPIQYPKHDNKISFDLLSSVYLANIVYTENQPYHLKLKDRTVLPIQVNYKEYASPETRYCPAGVYEILFDEHHVPRLQINGGNCIHCKACDIKDPTHNIVWTPSEGGSGPQYQMM